MSYQVLARKWRPKDFSEVVGQEHVVQALANALDQNKIHQAYVLSGTRGVGKTTIARILSKSLNCEAGLDSKPCHKCSTCESITDGSFMDFKKSMLLLAEAWMTPNSYWRLLCICPVHQGIKSTYWMKCICYQRKVLICF